MVDLHESAPADSDTISTGFEIGRIVDVNGEGSKIVVNADTRARVVDGDGKNLFQIGQIGSIVKVKVEGSWVYGVVREVTSRGFNGAAAFGDEADILYVHMDFLGQAEVGKNDGDPVTVRRGISKFPVPGQTVMTTDDSDLEAIFAPGSKPHITIGKLYPTHRVEGNLLIDPLLSKHFAVLGSTGTGKSSTLALMMHRIVEQMPNGHIIILDPHNEYQDAFHATSVHFDTENLALPYWMMNLEEMIEILIGRRTPDREADVDILKRCLLAAREKSVSLHSQTRVTVDSPVPYRLADLMNEIEVNMGKLDKPETLLPFLRLKNKLDELRNDKRYGFMFSGLLVNDNLSEIVSRLLRFPAQGRPISTLDLSGVPYDIVDVVVSVLARMVFDFAVWSRRETSQPLLLICEEAHRYVPNTTPDRFGAARKSLERIAKEGRKYGVSLGLVSQRPSDLSESVLSQCGTIISMRMNNDKDKQFVAQAMPEGSSGFMESLSSLANQECIVCGEGVTAPVRMRLDTLTPEELPSSNDPNFSQSWTEDTGDGQFVNSVIRRWRSEIR